MEMMFTERFNGAIIPQYLYDYDLVAFNKIHVHSFIFDIGNPTRH
jgi:hypothetical protein